MIQHLLTNYATTVFQGVLPCYIYLNSLRCRFRDSHGDPAEMDKGYMFGRIVRLLPDLCPGGGRKGKIRCNSKAIGE